MTPEEHFREGITALGAGRSSEAVDHFHRAVAAEKRLGADRPNMRYISFYGLSLALSKRATRTAIELCEKAAARDSFDSVLLLNLGKVYAVSGRITKALATYERGLRVDPSNKRLQIELARIERRRAPALPALGRDHVINRSLGRLRASFFAPKKPRGARARPQR